MIVHKLQRPPLKNKSGFELPVQQSIYYGEGKQPPRSHDYGTGGQLGGAISEKSNCDSFQQNLGSFSENLKRLGS